MIGRGGVGAGVGVVIDRSGWRSSGSARGDLSVGHVVGDQVTDEDVIDELGVAAVDAGVAIVGGLDARVEIPQPGPVTLIGLVVAAGADLGAGGPGRIWVVAASVRR